MDPKIVKSLSINVKAGNSAYISGAKHCFASRAQGAICDASNQATTDPYFNGCTNNY